MNTKLTTASLALLAVGVAIGAALHAVPAAPPKPAVAPRARAGIGGGTVTLPCSITPRSITLNADGSTMITVDREIGGGHRVRQNFISADGASFSLDGVPVASPPAAMTALGGVVSQLQTRFTAAYSTPGMSTLICAP